MDAETTGARERAVGIDVGLRRLHLVTVRRDGASRPVVESVAVVPAGEPGAATDRCAGATRVGVDAPGEPSRGVHRHDRTGRLSAKFRPARCGEIAAGQRFGVWVPWVTPVAGEPAPGWMSVGFALWSALRRGGAEVLETYPAGSVWLASGRRWPPAKTTVAGRGRRLALLAARADLPPGATAWDHDTIDAAVAGLVALAHDPAGRAAHDHPGCDGSSLWMWPPEDADRPVAAHPARHHGTARQTGISDRGGRVEDEAVIERIDELIAEEHALREQSVGSGLSDEQRARLEQVEVRLDQLWDLLRRRRASRSAGQDPDTLERRSPEVVEHYQQ